VLRTSAQRLRPILLITVTTVLGVMPMVLKVNVDLFARQLTFGGPSTDRCARGHPAGSPHGGRGAAALALQRPADAATRRAGSGREPAGDDRVDLVEVYNRGTRSWPTRPQAR
jgi:hypothetical protein